MKKLIGMAFVCLFMMSMTSVKSNTFGLNVIEEKKDCYDSVVNIVNQAINAGESEEFVDWLTNAAYAVFCYDYSWQDVFDAQGIN